MRLALAMGRPVSELLASMSSRELTDWIAYHEIEPWGETRADLRSGMAASAIANSSLRRPIYKPSDFMPFDKPPAPKRTTLMAKLRQFLPGMKREGE